MLPGQSHSTPGQGNFWWHQEVECIHCGGIFRAKRRDARYCSGACRQDAKRRRDGGSPEAPAEREGSGRVAPSHRPSRDGRSYVTDRGPVTVPPKSTRFGDALVLGLLIFTVARWYGDRVALERFRGQLDVVDGLFRRLPRE